MNRRDRLLNHFLPEGSIRFSVRIPFRALLGFNRVCRVQGLGFAVGSIRALIGFIRFYKGSHRVYMVL